jgi:hypothetical protein
MIMSAEDHMDGWRRPCKLMVKARSQVRQADQQVSPRRQRLSGLDARL